MFSYWQPVVTQPRTTSVNVAPVVKRAVSTSSGYAGVTPLVREEHLRALDRTGRDCSQEFDRLAERPGDQSWHR